MFFLQLGHFAQAMALTGSENHEQPGERRERRKPKTQHARKE
jgi:hypothetical protein